MFCAPYYNPVEYLIDLARTEKQTAEAGEEFIVTVGNNGKYNNSGPGEEPSQAVRGKNDQSQAPQTVTKQKSQHMKWGSVSAYHEQQNMWTALCNYNFSKKLNCQRASGENNLTTFLHQEKLKHLSFKWKGFQVFCKSKQFQRRNSSLDFVCPANEEQIEEYQLQKGNDL